MAVVSRDGFVCLESGGQVSGEVVTRPSRFSGSRLYVNMQMADAGPGDLKVEILDPAYFPVPGHTLKDADPLTRTGLDNVVTWNGSTDISRLAGRAVQLRFYLRNAKLFSFRFAD